MKFIMLVIILLCPFHACRERKPVDAAAEFEENTASEEQQSADGEALPDAPVEAPKEEDAPATESEVPAEPAPTPTPSPVPAPVVLIKPAAKYNEFCSFAKKLETTESIIRLSTENFGFKADGGAVDTLQCLVTLDATVPKGKRLVPVILPQSYFTGLGMFGAGQSLQVDLSILTLAGDNIEASLEYQALAMGPIANDTEFVRTMQLMRRISPPCQLLDEAKRTVAILIVLTLNKGTSASLPPVVTRELPRIDYVMENCSVS